MADPQTPDLGLNVPTHGSDVGTWDASLNYNFNVLDARANGTLTIGTSSNPGGIFLTAAQSQNARFVLTGTPSANFTVTMASSVTGGQYQLDTTQANANFAYTIALPSSLGGRSLVASTPGLLTFTSDGINVDTGNNLLPNFASQAAVEFIVDGGGAAISTGSKGYLEMPFNFTINQWTLLGDIAGFAAFDIWMTPYVSISGATSANSLITIGTSVPALQGGLTAQSTALTAWNTFLPLGNILAFNVSSVGAGSSVGAPVPTRVTLSLRGTKS